MAYNQYNYNNTGWQNPQNQSPGQMAPMPPYQGPGSPGGQDYSPPAQPNPGGNTGWPGAGWFPGGQTTPWNNQWLGQGLGGGGQGLGGILGDAWSGMTDFANTGFNSPWGGAAQNTGFGNQNTWHPASGQWGWFGSAGDGVGPDGYSLPGHGADSFTNLGNAGNAWHPASGQWGIFDDLHNSPFGPSGLGGSHVTNVGNAIGDTIADWAGEPSGQFTNLFNPSKWSW